jgi:hypothetical protein
VATTFITFDSTLPENSGRPAGCGAINLEWFDDGVPLAEAADRLSGRHNILVRVGLHCAPLAHRTIGTFPNGTVRLSVGYLNTLEDIELTVEAIRHIATTRYGDSS